MIKCSSCGVDIDILQLADHVCAPVAPSSMCITQLDMRTSSLETETAATAITPPESPKLDRASSLGSFSKRSEGQAPTGRMRAPPRIDSNAASKELIERCARDANTNFCRQTIPAARAFTYE
jgi:hypothetical protein